MKNSLIRTIFFLAFLCAPIFFTTKAQAFALLGPFQPWMEETNGFRQPGDIGGPMDIGSGYRWNVPVITYGFDQSFLDYFGTNGVVSVESAIQTLNDLPKASDIVLTNYPLNSTGYNSVANAQGLYDLKSATLSLLVEHLGLAQPTRYIYALNGWNPDLFIYSSGEFDAHFYGMPPNFLEFVDSYPYVDPETNVLNFLIGRNFDPETFAWSSTVNGTWYGGQIQSWLAGANSSLPDGFNYVTTFFVDPNISIHPAVADGATSFEAVDAGQFYTGLTYDDVGGLSYLYSSNDVNFETLLSDVQVVNTNWITFTTNTISLGDRHRPPKAHGPPVTVPPPHGKTIIVVVTNVVTSTNVLVNGAWRPGVEKIVFMAQPSGPQSGSFLPLTNRYTDTYFSNGAVMHQQVQRITTSPDILFCAGNVFQSTGTTNWLNNSFLNGNTNGEGPGVITPQVKITFDKRGPVVVTGNIWNEVISQSWASFDDSTNLPVVYPQGVQPNQLAVQFFFFENDIEISNQIFSLSVPIGGTAALQISTDQINWTSLATVTNAGSVIQWEYYGSDNPHKYFRVTSQ